MKLKEQDNFIERFYSELEIKDSLKKQFNPRPVATPHGYFNPNYYNTHLLFKYLRYTDPDYRIQTDTFYEGGSFENTVEKLSREQHAKDVRNSYILSLVQEEFPTYFIGLDLLKAAEHTNPADFSFKDIKMPRNPMVLVFPAFHLHNDAGIHVPFAGIYKGQDGDNTNLFIDMYTATKDKFQGQVSHIAECNSFAEFVNHKKDQSLPLDSVTTDLVRHSLNLFNYTADLVLKILLIINSVPKLIDVVEPSHSLSPKEKERKKNKFHQPLWIGLHYKIPKEHSSLSHASPMIHWRRGHLRNQAYGPAMSLRRIIWIEPCIVGANS